MTGIYLFATRDGKRKPVEIEHLTDEERREKFIDNPERILQYLNALCLVLSRIESSNPTP